MDAERNVEIMSIVQNEIGHAAVVPLHAGEPYIAVLKRLHSLLKPRAYLEIGTNTGDSLKAASCDSLAIDPAFKITGEVIGSKSRCLLFQMPSDLFFKNHDAEKTLGARVDLAFLDGMHLSEFLLRDFMNVERACHSNSIIAIHDCLPTDAYIAERVDNRARREALSTTPGWWAGDVWKVIVLLKTFRPDLTIYALDAPPTGLILVTNLDPNSKVLADNYSAIVNKFRSMELIDYGLARFHEEVDIRPTSDFSTFEDLHAHFWL